MSDKLVARWIDHGREPQVPPNPAYPLGIDLDARPEGYDGPSCTASLPYPAARCGAYEITCSTCGLRVHVTTAGRPDDPRSVTVMCLGQQA